MKKVEAIIRPERLQQVQDALDTLGVSGLTVTEVVGCGRQKGYTEQYRGARANISLLHKIKVEAVVPSDLVKAAVEAIVSSAAAGLFTRKVTCILPVELSTVFAGNGSAAASARICACERMNVTAFKPSRARNSASIACSSLAGDWRPVEKITLPLARKLVTSSN